MRAVFLDRDGTLIRAYQGRPANTVEEVELLPTVAEGIVKLKSMGFALVVVTNQGGVALGFNTLEGVREMHVRLNDLLIKAVAPEIDAFYICPHATDAKCECRKPKPGMLNSAILDLGIENTRSYMIGDDPRDMEAAFNAGVPSRFMVISDRFRHSTYSQGSASKFIQIVNHIERMENSRC